MNTDTETCPQQPRNPKFERRILTIIDQCRRFERMANSLKPWAENWSIETLERWLELPQIGPSQLEMVLTALALKATARSGAALDAYDPADASDNHEVYHRVCRIEWEQRHSSPSASDTAA